MFPHPFIQLVTTTGNTQRIICFMFSLVHSKEAQLLVNCIQKKKQVWTLSITKGVWSCRRGDLISAAAQGSDTGRDHTAPLTRLRPQHSSVFQSTTCICWGNHRDLQARKSQVKRGRGVNRLNTLSQKWISDRGLVKVCGGYKVETAKYLSHQ